MRETTKRTFLLRLTFCHFVSDTTGFFFVKLTFVFNVGDGDGVFLLLFHFSVSPPASSSCLQQFQAK